MKTRKIFQSATIMVLVMLCIIGMTTVVRAQGPWPWSQVFPWPTTTPWPTARALSVGEHFSFGFAVFPATPVPSNRPPSNFAPPVAPALVVTAPGGDNPANALIPNGGSRTLASGASVWYKVGNGGEHIEVSLDANPLSGMALYVYAPGNSSDPIGQGSLQKSTGRLFWAGGHWQSEGAWLARVANNNPMAVQYTLTSSGQAIGNKSCYSYWENLPTGQRVYWTECQK
jgi:hypothetical protein